MKILKTWQKIVIAFCGAGFLLSLILIIPFIQNLILDFGENVIVHRPLTREVWRERFIEWFGTLGLFLLAGAIPSVFFFYELKNFLEKDIKNDSNSKIANIICLITVISFCLLKFFFYNIIKNSLFTGTNSFHTIILLMLIFISTLWLLFYTKISIEKQFLIFWTLFSMMFLFSSTPFNVPDEETHFCRIYEISEGNFITDKSGGRHFNFTTENMTNLEENWISFSKHKYDNLTDESYFHQFSTAGLYSPLSYIPQSIGFFIARVFTKNFTIIVYAGRIFSWLFITAILFFAICIIPNGKEIITLIALIPMNIHEAVSLSPDAQIVAISIFMIAFVMRAKATTNTNNFKFTDYAILYSMAILISMIKITYLPFCFVYFLIPQEKFGSKKNKILHAIIIAIIVIALNLIWLNFCKQFLTKSDTNASEQVNFILTHPISYLTVLIRTYIKRSLFLITTMFGSLLNELNLKTSPFLIAIYCIFLLLKFVPQTKEKLKFNSQKFCFLIIIVSIILLISTSLYIQWNPPKSKIIGGLQGRYFLSLLLPLYFFCNTYNKSETEKKLSIATVTLTTIINSCACLDLLIASI